MNITKSQDFFFPTKFQYIAGGLYIIHLTEEEYNEFSVQGKTHTYDGRDMTPFSTLPIETRELLRGRIMRQHGYLQLIDEKEELEKRLKEINSKIYHLEQ